jgi:bifunctional NMN adenylyltransferase/nudix hydrolase
MNAAADPDRAGVGGTSRAEEDRRAIEEYRRKHGEGPFLAADAVVWSADGHALLIRRSKAPGRGLLALPGGFVEPTETFLEAAVRELIEETGIKISAGDGGDIASELIPEAEAVFDEPNRDPRARVVSVAYFFPMRHAAREMPLEAGDDAAAAIWRKIDERTSAADFFADHFRILRHFGLAEGGLPPSQRR